MGMQNKAEVTKRHWRNRSKALGVQPPPIGRPEAVIKGLSYELRVSSSRLLEGVRHCEAESFVPT